jgi:hypothetical protein
MPNPSFGLTLSRMNNLDIPFSKALNIKIILIELRLIFLWLPHFGYSSVLEAKLNLYPFSIYCSSKFEDFHNLVISEYHFLYLYIHLSFLFYHKHLFAPGTSSVLVTKPRCGQILTMGNFASNGASPFSM